MGVWADRFLALLNKTDGDPLFVKLLSDLALMESPVVRDEPVECFTFTELGVSLYAFNGTFYSVHFHIAPAALADGKATLPYVNDLPFGLNLPQSMKTVRSIMGEPHQVNKVVGSYKELLRSESYELDGRDVTAWYSVPDEKLSTLIVHVLLMPSESSLDEAGVRDAGE